MRVQRTDIGPPQQRSVQMNQMNTICMTSVVAREEIMPDTQGTWYVVGDAVLDMEQAGR